MITHDVPRLGINGHGYCIFADFSEVLAPLTLPINAMLGRPQPTPRPRLSLHRPPNLLQCKRVSLKRLHLFRAAISPTRKHSEEGPLAAHY